MGGMRQDEFSSAHGFQVEISGGADAKGTDGSWKMVRGGGLRIEEASGVTRGDDKHRHFSPGKKVWEDIHLVGPVTKTRKDMLKWFNDTVSGDEDKKRRNISIIILGKNGKETHRYDYNDCFMTSYRMTELDAEGQVECEEEIGICVGYSPNYLK